MPGRSRDREQAAGIEHFASFSEMEIPVLGRSRDREQAAGIEHFASFTTSRRA